MAQDTILEDDATKQEIDEYVGQISAEAEEDRKGEDALNPFLGKHGLQVSDAQITSEHADNEKTPAAEGDNVPSGEKTGKGDSTDSDDSDWRTDAKAETAAFGISDEELAEFASREELDRVLNVFDRKLDEERQKLLDERESSDDRSTESVEQSVEQSNGSFEIGLDSDIYDEELVDEFTRMRDHYEGRIASLEQRFTDADSIVAEKSFDRGVDSLEFPKLFGKTGEESGEEMNRREELFEQVEIEQIVMKRLGRNVDSDALVRRVARSLFPDEYDKRLLKNHTRKISRQSDKRQGAGGTRPTDPPETPREEADRRYREMVGV